jgi:S1-C subfamily serine protease
VLATDRRLAVVGLVLGAILGGLIATGPTGAVVLGSPVAVLGARDARLGRDLREQVGRATVAVASQGCEGALVGSGVVTRGGLLVTAAHVAGGARRVRVSGASGNLDASPVLVAEGLDVSSVGVPASWPALAEAHADPPPGAPVLVATRARGDLRVREARVEGYVSGVAPGDPGRVMRLDLGAEPGDSGGPVVDARGRLVGIVYLRERITGRALVMPVSALRRGLGGPVAAGRC